MLTYQEALDYLARFHNSPDIEEQATAKLFTCIAYGLMSNGERAVFFCDDVLKQGVTRCLNRPSVGASVCLGHRRGIRLRRPIVDSGTIAIAGGFD